MFLSRPSDGTGGWGLPFRAPRKATFASGLPLPLSSRSVAFKAPLGPWLGSLESGSSRGSCPVAKIEAPPTPGLCPDHPAPGPGGAWRGRRAVLPGWPAVVWLHPRDCGLGTTSCLLREAAGISRTNRTNRSLPPTPHHPPGRTPGGALPLTSSTDTSPHSPDLSGGEGAE